MSEAKSDAAPSLDAVRQRIDALDTELLRLIDERASLARVVAAAKRAAGDGGKFGLRPGREAAILRRLIASERKAADAGLIVGVWQELIGDSLAGQGPFHISVWGARDPGRRVDQRPEGGPECRWDGLGWSLVPRKRRGLDHLAIA